LLAKPVNRVQFLVAKLLGLLAALGLFVYINALAALLALRIAKDQFQLEMIVMGLFFGALILASIIGAVRNYYRRTSFTASAIQALAVLLTLVAILVFFLPPRESSGYEWHLPSLGFSSNLARALVLVLFATWAMGALAAALSTRLTLVSNLTVCFVVFCLGLISDYLYAKTLALQLSDLQQAVHYWPLALLPVLLGIWLLTAKHYHRRRQALPRWEIHASYGALTLALLARSLFAWQQQAHLETPRGILAGLAQVLFLSKNLLAEMAHALIPNWQLLFLADAITNQATIPWSYLALGLAYVVTFITTFLVLATLLFANREVGGQGQVG
jgi:hypothetical protein